MTLRNFLSSQLSKMMELMEGFTVMNAIGTAEDLAVAAVADQALDDKTKKTAPVKTGAVFLFE